MKSKILGLLAVGLLAGPMAANAALIKVDFTVSGGYWFNDNGLPYGMGLSPTLSGTMLVDNTLSGASALKDFSLTTGIKTWTESLFAGPVASFIFDSNGDLSQFSLSEFQDGTGEMYLYSDNTFYVTEFEEDGAFSNACNGCVAFTQSRVAVPEPGTLALLGLGLLGLGITRRKAA